MRIISPGVLVMPKNRNKRKRAELESTDVMLSILLFYL